MALQKEHKVNKDPNESDEEDDFFASKDTRRSSKSPSTAFANFITQLSLCAENNQDGERMGIEEKLEMFKVSEKYSKGSVQVARGRKMTVLPAEAQHTTRRDKVCKIVDEANKRCTQAQMRRTRGNEGME